MRLDYMHWYRGLAMVYIIVWHSLTQTLDFSTPTARLLQSLLFNGTALFVFISGFLFAYLAPRYQWQGFMKKKALHVLLPYLVVSLPGILWRLTQLHHGVLPVDYVPAAVIDKPIPFVIWSLLTGFHIGPLWFVPFVCLLFLCSPLFHRLVTSPALGAVTALALLVTLFTFRPQYNLNPLWSLLHFSGFYLLGIWVCRHRDHPWLASTRLIGVLALLLAALVLWELRHPIPVAFSIQELLREGVLRLNVNAAQKVVMCVLTLMLLRQVEQRRSLWFPRTLLSRVAEYSFGIYFVHHYFMMVLGELTKRLPPIDMDARLLLVSLPHFVLSMLASMALIYLVKLTTKTRSRYLVGV